MHAPAARWRTGAGSLILDEVAAQVPNQRVLVSETDILDGIAHQLLRD